MGFVKCDLRHISLTSKTTEFNNKRFEAAKEHITAQN